MATCSCKIVSATSSAKSGSTVKQSRCVANVATITHSLAGSPRRELARAGGHELVGMHASSCDVFENMWSDSAFQVSYPITSIALPCADAASSACHSVT